MHTPLLPPLVTAQELQVRLDDPRVLPVEVSADAWTYYAGHVPGAVVLDWYDDLHAADARGALERTRLEDRLGARGVDRDTHVVLYGDTNGMYAAYAHWLLRYYRHPGASVLDGGRAAWVAAGGQLSEAVPERLPTLYRSPGPDPSVRLLRDEVLAEFVQPPPGRPLLDCRVPEAFAGAPRHVEADLALAGVRLAGHIPGAVNVPAQAVLDPRTGRFRSPSALRALFTAAGVRPDREVALYCGEGAESALVWFALTQVVGHPRARLYDGGWAEYAGLVAVPASR